MQEKLEGAIYVAFRGKSQQILLDVQWGEMFFEGASAYLFDN